MEPTFLSTTELAAAIRARRISAAEALAAHLAQIDRHNPVLNAVVTLDAEAARARAHQADEALVRGEVWGPLHGVPFTLKDAHATAGMRTTIGFPPFADHVPKGDGTVAARLKAAGGILVGKTNVATMLADYQTDNPIFGRTNNPWDIARTPGGSSGGAAAGIAAGMTPFDIGTDLSASIRIPAHFCGIFGLKPTERRVSLAGVVPIPGDPPRAIRIMTSVGPMARTVEDLAFLFGIIAGPDGRDTEVAPVPVEEAPERVLTGLRVAIAPTFAGIPVAADIRSRIATLAADLDTAGAVVEEAKLPPIDFGADLQSAGALIGMMVAAFEEGAEPTPLAAYLEALHRRDRSIRAWEHFFGAWEVLICPASMVTAFPHCPPGSPIAVDGKKADYWSLAAHGTLFNYSGHPALVLPCGADSAGLPIGLQLVGKRWGEAPLLAIARALSPLTGIFRRPPGY